ncbi:MAG: hypothetical protein O2913_12420 [Chloroflexi bacterium]|nr:hypothetical protein [Chloroflexota bacterium]
MQQNRLEDAKAELDAQRQQAPAKNQLTILQQEVYDRCRLRSKKFPQGDHSWMTSLNDMQRFKDHAFSEKVILAPADEEGFVTLRYIKTCSICLDYTTERTVTDSLLALSMLNQLPYPMTIESVRNDLKNQVRIEVDSV